VGFAAILPADIAVAELAGEAAPGPLLGEEQALAARMVPARRAELARGRTCARRALAQLGVAAQPILADEDRAPRWPAGIVGSITHCCGFGAAAVARADRWSAIGIDAELEQRIDPEVRARIALDRELVGLDPELGPCLVFSAKEAFFKAWYPAQRRWLDFHDVRAQIDPGGTFSVEVLIAGAGRWPRRVTGRFVVEHGRVLTAVALPA
jgi:4'-phosphopantetheinyl transferase EntD